MRKTSVHAHFGSLRVTVACFGLLAAVVLARPAFVLLAPVLAALTLNLLVALATHPLLRRQLPLLVAHLALLVLVALVAAGRLVRVDGRFELAQGLHFDGRLLDEDAAEAHAEAWRRLDLRHDGFEIDYAAGRQRGPTRNTVHWTDQDGLARSAVIGDHHPLVIDNYRFYTSPNKGFAPVLRWEPDTGEPLRGTMHLPSYPLQELRQSNEWRLPDGRSMWAMLQIDETLIDPAAPASFRLPTRPRLVVRLDSARVDIREGESAVLPGGRLVFEGLRTWMGYRVVYDPTLPWLLASSLLAALGMAGHYLQKFWPRWVPSTRRAARGLDG